MATSRELREKRAAIIEQMKEAVKLGEEARAKGESASDYDKQFDRAEADERALSKQIAALERIEADEKRAAGEHIEDLDRRGEGPSDKPKKDDYITAYRTWFRHGDAGLNAEMRALLAEKRGTNTQVGGTTTLGGYTIDTELIPELVKALKAYSGIFQAARIRPTAQGNTLYVATLDDTSTEASLITEGSSITVQDLTFGQKQLDAYSYKTMMKVSWELMQDSSFNMESEIRDAMGPRFGRALNSSCTTGTGSSQPNGVVTASTLGVTTSSAIAFTMNEITDLIHSVDPAYRMSPKCGFMFHDVALAAIKKLAIGSSDARSLWMPSFREGEPDRIEGYPYWINQGMDNTINTASKIMLFGDFDYYNIRLVQNLLIIRLNERFADNGITGFVGYMRWDGELLNTAAVKHMLTA